MKNILMKTFLSVGIMILIGCSATEAIVYMEATSDQDIQLNMRIEGDLSLVMMNYFEDLDVLRGQEPNQEELPSVFNEIASWLTPFSTTIMQRRGQQRIYTEVQVASLAELTSNLENHLNLESIKYYQDQEKVHHLVLKAGQEVFQELYAAMPSLPKAPSRWTKATRKEYIEQLANVFGSTKAERSTLSKELESAVLNVTIIAPKRYRISAKSATSEGSSANNEVVLKLNIVDFLAGYDSLELAWYAIGSI